MIELQMEQTWNQIWKRLDDREIYEWMADNMELHGAYGVSGKFDVELSPYLKRPFEYLRDPRIEQITIYAPTRGGKSLIADGFFFWSIPNRGGTILWAFDVEETARKHYRGRLWPFFHQDFMRPLMPADRHAVSSTGREGTLTNGAFFRVTGSALTNFQNQGVKTMILDETWLFEKGRIRQAKARLADFRKTRSAKLLIISQGGEQGDQTDLEWMNGSREEWEIQCCGCGKYQLPIFQGKREDGSRFGIMWDRNENTFDENGNPIRSRLVETIRYECEFCGHVHLWGPRLEREWNRTGRYRRTSERNDPKEVSLRWNSFILRDWTDTVLEFWTAKEAVKKGDVTLLKAWMQKEEAKPWEDMVSDFTIQIKSSGYRLGTDWDQEAGILPDAHGKPKVYPANRRTDDMIPFRCLTVDKQLDHFYAIIRQWSANGSSRLTWYDKLLTWEEIEEVQESYKVHPSFVGVDCGDDAFNVYRECAKRKWTALRGDKKRTWPHQTEDQNGVKRTVQRYYSKKNIVSLGQGLVCKMHYWSNLMIKDTLAYLRANQANGEQPGHELPLNVTQDYLDQMESERRMVDEKTGQEIWRQIGKRPNHYWDCEAEQVVFATMLKVVGKDSVLEKSN